MFDCMRSFNSQRRNTMEVTSVSVQKPVTATLFSRNEFTILCVTKTTSKAQVQKNKEGGKKWLNYWHIPIQGKIVIEVIAAQIGELKIPAETRVLFQGDDDEEVKECKFLYFRTGLGDCCYVVAVEAPRRKMDNDIWEIYFNEPTAKGKVHGITLEEPSTMDGD